MGIITKTENNYFRNKVTSILRKSKITYYKRMFSNNQSNMKQTWYLINDLLSKKVSHSKIKKIVVNNSEYTDEAELASIFNDYFCSIGTLLDLDIPFTATDPLSFLSPNVDSSFHLLPVSDSEIFHIITGLKNSKQDLNSISSKLFIDNADILSLILTDLINYCFAIGKFPISLKKAEVLPLYKKGDSTIISNFRPISILPMLSKIMERCIKSRLVNYFDTYSLINSCQFGFKKGISTQDAILNLTEQIYKSLDENCSAVGVFIDFSKAFDTVNRNILLRKLSNYGINGLPLRLLSSYLSDRTQAVRIGNILSPFKEINLGLPQGSVLAPLLFVIYINDLPLLSDLFSVTLYADDSTLVFKHSEFDPLIRSCNSGLELFLTWCRANRLSINIDQTYYMIFSNKIEQNIQPGIILNNVVLKRKSSVCFLGVELDDKFKFNCHINYICKKIAKSTGILHRLRDYLPMKTLIGLYYSFIYSYLNYCILVWGGTSQSHIQPLEIIQRKCIRIINKSHYLAHSSPLFAHNKILKFSDIFNLNSGIYMYNNIVKFNHLLPAHNHSTRFRSNYVPSFNRLSLTQRQSLFSILPSIWNDLPDAIKSSPSIFIFKKRYKQYLLSGYLPDE